MRANKHQVKEAVELIWPKVTVLKVRVMNMPAKRARRWRKSYHPQKRLEKGYCDVGTWSTFGVFRGSLVEQR